MTGHRYGGKAIQVINIISNYYIYFIHAYSVVHLLYINTLLCFEFLEYIII